MRIFLILIVWIWGASLFAERWEGRWAGECQLKRFDGSEESRSIEFFSEKIFEGEWSWKLKLGQTPTRLEEKKDYILNEFRPERGEFHLNESNGVVLNAYVSDDKIRIPFLNRGQLILVNYQFNGNFLNIEVPYYTDRPIRQSCSTRGVRKCSYVLGMFGYEQCFLQKIP